jgi:hypothetical protein
MIKKDYFLIEPIDEEVVTFADDFYFKLTDTQVKAKLDALRKRQEYVYRGIMHYGTNVRPECREFIYRIGLMIDYCYNKFYFPIPIITHKRFIDLAKLMEEESREYKKVNPNDDTYDTNKELDDLNQEHLVDAIAEKLGYYEHALECISQKENEEVGYFMITFITLYSDEVLIRKSK